MPVQEGIAKLSGKEQAKLGLPDDMQTYSAAPFGSMNQQDSRTALQGADLYWLENFLQIGRSDLRTIGDIGPALYTAPAGKTIIYFYWFIINSNVACAVFLSDGTAVQVAYPGGKVAPISSQTDIFYQGTELPVAQQWGSQYLLIANNNSVNNYWIWDGSILYGPGTVGPYQLSNLTSGGSGYTSTPTLTFYGGSGTGVQGTATITNGSVTLITITNPGIGFSPSDQSLQVAFSGGGSDTGAILTAGLTATKVASVNVAESGSGYASAPTVAFSGGGGTGAAATATITNGVVSGVTITNQGSGYSSAPSVALVGGGGTGATAVATLAATTLGGVNIVNGGSGYTGTPTISFSGGGGSGAAGTVTVTNGVITAVNLTSGGTDYTSAPEVVVEAGLNNAASAKIDLMPFGVSGTSIETFQNRVWISRPASPGPLYNGGVFNVSAPESLTDFSTSNGGLLYTSTDHYLRDHYVALHQSNGYLYPIADSSVDTISNVQTSGTPATTSFNYFNVSAVVGTSWRDTVQDYGQSVLFANENGAFGLYGGSTQSISDKISKLFASAVWPPTAGAVKPSSAVANIYTFPIYLTLMTITDPVTLKPRTVMLGWNQQNWFVVSQSIALTFIATKIQNSVMQAWGTDGTKLVQLFAQPSTTLQKKIMTKMWAAETAYIIKEPLAAYVRASDKTTQQSGVALNVTFEAYGIARQAGQQTELNSMTYPAPVQPNFSAPDPAQPVSGFIAPAVAGNALGLTITTTSPDILISDISCVYRNVAPVFG